MTDLQQICRTGIYLFLFVAGAVWAPSQSPDLPSQPGLENRILNGDEDAMLKAGASGDKAFVPLLRRQLDTRHARTARRALARLGDTEAQQDMWCAAVHPRGGPADSYTSDFGYVGGWFGIQGLEVFLESGGERRWNEEEKKRQKKEKNATDVAIDEPPHYFALLELRRLLPDSPAGKGNGTFRFMPPEFGSCMVMWIAERRDQLKTMEPTGEGVDFSPTACKHRRVGK